MRFVSRLIHAIERTVLPLHAWMLGFLSILFIRYFFEGVSSGGSTGFFPTDFPTNLHYTLFYISMTLVFAIILSVFTKKTISDTTKITIVALPIIWVAPVVDFIVLGHARMTYLFEHWPQLLNDFLTFFGPLQSSGITFGMRAEFILILFGVFVYIFSSTHSWWRSLVGPLCVYVFLFLSSSLPSLLVFWSGQDMTVLYQWWWAIHGSTLSFAYFHPTDTFDFVRNFELLFSASMSQIWYLLGVSIFLVWVFLYSSTQFRAVFGNIRLIRLMNYLGVYVIGIIAAMFVGVTQGIFSPLTLISIIVGGIALCCAWIFSVATNDLVDVPIDRITNPTRPLVMGTLAREEMKHVAMLSGMWTILGGGALGSYGCFFVLVFLCIYATYSLPPLRLKRVPVLASFLIAVAHLVSMMLGFFLVSSARMLSDFPQSLALLVIVAFTLAVNVKDLKDRVGDHKEGVYTLPVLFGEVTGRYLVGGMLFLSYLCVPFFFPFRFFFPAMFVVGLVAWWAVVKGKSERFLFVLHCSAIFALVVIWMAFIK